jgi:hypothetical protein
METTIKFREVIKIITYYDEDPLGGYILRYRYKAILEYGGYKSISNEFASREAAVEEMERLKIPFIRDKKLEILLN